MTRDLITQILSDASGVDTKDGRFEVDDAHQVSFYLGQVGQAMVVSEVAHGVLSDEYVALTTREKNTTVYVAYDAIHAVSSRPPRDEETRRAGFS